MRIRRSVLSVLCIAAFMAPVTGHTRPPLVESGSLTLQQPSAQNEYIIEGAVWTCADTACHANMVADMPVLRSCKRVVEVTGAVTQFSYRGTDLTADQLAQCNVRARK